MILLNFGHPLTHEQLRQIVELAGASVERVIDIDARIDLQQPIAPQVVAMADRAGLSAAEWQSLPLVVNLPGLAISAGVLLAEIHGRCGHFPTVLCLRRVPDAVPPRFEVAALLALQGVRDAARQRRCGF